MEYVDEIIDAANKRGRLVALIDLAEWLKATRALYAQDVNNMDQVQVLDMVLARIREMAKES